MYVKTLVYFKKKKKKIKFGFCTGATVFETLYVQTSLILSKYSKPFCLLLDIHPG